MKQTDQGIFLVDHLEPLKDHEQECGTKGAEEALDWGRVEAEGDWDRPTPEPEEALSLKSGRSEKT